MGRSRAHQDDGFTENGGLWGASFDAVRHQFDRYDRESGYWGSLLLPFATNLMVMAPLWGFTVRMEMYMLSTFDSNHCRASLM